MNHSELIDIFIQCVEDLRHLKPLNQEKFFREYRDGLFKYFFNPSPNIEKDRDRIMLLSPRSKFKNTDNVGGGFCLEINEALAYRLRELLEEKDLLGFEIKMMYETESPSNHCYLYFAAQLNAKDQVFYRLDLWDTNFTQISQQDFIGSSIPGSKDPLWGPQRVMQHHIWKKGNPLTNKQSDPVINTHKLEKNEKRYEGQLPPIFNLQRTADYDGLICKLNQSKDSLDNATPEMPFANRIQELSSSIQALEV